MKGNVWEWSADCWQPFSYAPNESSETCDKRVVLGGAWSTERDEVNGQVAAWEKSSRKTNSIGFRAVRSLP
jgi:formylglycine-generating enzyme required for sulfatase activity